jgi:RimJ/RimL family protein N-acetyltransferase
LGRISLRPFDPSDLPIAWYWIKDYYWRVADDYAPQNERDFIKHQLGRDSVRAGVYRDGELGGLMICEGISPVLCEGHCYFKKGFWGWETTLPALHCALKAAWALGYDKMICPVFAKNRLMARLLVEIGAIPEAFLQSHTRQHGQPVDVVYFSLFREGIKR